MKGRIYKISCKSDPNLVYVGSTTKSLRDRLSIHKCDCRKMWFNAKLYQQIIDNDWSDWEMELIEEVQFEDKNDLRKREGEYIQSIGTLNIKIAGRDRKESCKQYRENNRDKIREINKQYREDNKDEIKKYHRDVYNANKHYRNNLLKKCFNAFKNHRDD